MKNTAQYIGYVFVFVLMFFLVAVSGAMYSLGNKMPSDILPSGSLILVEIAYYFAVLYLFYTNKKIATDVWLRAMLVILIVRTILALTSGYVFSFIGTEKLSLTDGFFAAIYGNWLVQLFQFAATPFLSYPFLYASLSSTKASSRASIYTDTPVQSPQILAPNAEDVRAQAILPKQWSTLLEPKNANDTKMLLKNVRLSAFSREAVVPKNAHTATQPNAAKTTTPTPQSQASPQNSPRATQNTSSSTDELDRLLEVATSQPVISNPVPIQEPVQQNPPQQKQQISEISLPSNLPPALDGMAPFEELTSLDDFLPPIGVNMNLPDLPPIGAPFAQNVQPGGASTPPEGGYKITSINDFYTIPFRKLIDVNEGSQAAAILQKLIKRGANFDLAIPIELLVPMLQLGKASVSVEYIYSESPIELVNFMSADQSGDLSEIEVQLPLGEIMAITDPQVIFGGEGTPRTPQSFSQPEPEPEPEPEITEEIPMTQQSTGFSPELVAFAKSQKLTPMFEQTDTISVLSLSQQGMTFAIAPFAQWAATTKLSDLWGAEGDFAFVESDLAAIIVRFGSAIKSDRDAIAIVASPQMPDRLLQIAADAAFAWGNPENLETADLYEPESAPFEPARPADIFPEYSGSYAKFPGKTMIILSALSHDPDDMARIAGIGIRAMQHISGFGRLFANWTKAFFCSGTWTLGVVPMPGGAVIVELPANMDITSIMHELERVSVKAST